MENKIINYINNFWVKTVSPTVKSLFASNKENTDKIVKAIENKEYETVNPDSISDPIVEAQNKTTQAVENLEIPKEITVKNFPLFPEFPNNSEIVDAINELKEKIEGLELKPNITVKNDLNKFLALFRSGRDKNDIINALEKLKESFDSLVIPESKDYTNLIKKISEKIDSFEFKSFVIPEELIENNQIKVKVDRVGSGGWGREIVGVKNIIGAQVNPATNEELITLNTKDFATEETLQAVLAASGGSVYNFIQSEISGAYEYYGYASSTGWKFKRMTVATEIWMVASGVGDYDTAWADKISKDYNYV
jgi:hypothetical protein